MSRANVQAIICWDVLLPLTLIFGPPLSRSLHDVVEVSWVVVVPAIACLWRGAAAMQRLRAAGFAHPNFFRQLALGLAIVLQMFNEISSRLAAALQGAPPIYQWMPWVLFAAYLLLLWLAFSRASAIGSAGRSSLQSIDL